MFLYPIFPVCPALGYNANRRLLREFNDDIHTNTKKKKYKTKKYKRFTAGVRWP